MDAVEYLKTLRRICKEKEWGSSCMDCPAVHICGGTICHATQEEMAEALKTIEAWEEEHPAKTRQNEFLKMFPRADMPVGIINIKPCEVDIEVYHKECGNFDSCWPCMRKYWLEEIE